MPSKSNPKRGGKTVTPFKKLVAQKLKTRLQNESTDDKASVSEEEYPIRADSPIDLRMTPNRSK